MEQQVLIRQVNGGFIVETNYANYPSQSRHVRTDLDGVFQVVADYYFLELSHLDAEALQATAEVLGLSEDEKERDGEQG